MGTRTIIPFGPQHPVLPEPIHLDLVVEDETVVEAIPSIGFIHRGLEKLVEKREYPEMVFVIERVCGICAFGHGWGYVHTVEGLMNVEVPPRAQFLRTIWHEMSRIHSHLLWLGLMADGMGFESAFMHFWRIREQLLDVFEKTTGARVIFSVCKVGGLRLDIDDAMIAETVAALNRIRDELTVLRDTFLYDSSVHDRLSGVGVLSKQDAIDLGAAGPTARGSGVALDVRLDGHGVYDQLGFEPIVETAGDCWARTMVRMREVYQSIDMSLKGLNMLPDGPIEVPVKGRPKGEFIARIEQPRGEAVYYARGNDTRNLDRFRVRTPTFMNVPALVRMLQGCDLADVPPIVLSIDPCISCTER